MKTGKPIAPTIESHQGSRERYQLHGDESIDRAATTLSQGMTFCHRLFRCGKVLDLGYNFVSHQGLESHDEGDARQYALRYLS